MPRRFGAALLHQVNQRQRGLAFGQIITDIFADFGGVARIIEHIIDDLKSCAHIHAVIFQRLLLLRRSTGQNRAHLGGGFEKLGGFVLNHLHIFGFGDVGVADIHQLHHLALGNNIGGIGHHFENFHAARAHHQLECAGVEKIAHQHGSSVAEKIVGRLAAAAQFAFIHHIIVQQGGSVDKFHHCRERIELFVVVAQRFAGQNGDNRAQALAAGADDIGADLGNQCHFRLHGLADYNVDFGQIFVQMALEIRQIFKHGCWAALWLGRLWALVFKGNIAGDYSSKAA